MLKVASCTVGHMVVRSYGRKSKFFQLDGLLLFGIIMALCSASSAIREYDFLYITIHYLMSPWLSDSNIINITNLSLVVLFEDMLMHSYSCQIAVH